MSDRIEIKLERGFVKRNAIHVDTEERLSLLVRGAKVDLRSAHTRMEPDPEVFTAELLVHQDDLSQEIDQWTAPIDTAIAVLLGHVVALKNARQFIENQLRDALLRGNVEPLEGGASPAE